MADENFCFIGISDYPTGVLSGGLYGNCMSARHSGKPMRISVYDEIRTELAAAEENSLSDYRLIGGSYDGG